MIDTDKKPKYGKNLYLGLLAQQCSRYEDMFTYLENIVTESNKDLTTKERELLSYGYYFHISNNCPIMANRS